MSSGALITSKKHQLLKLASHSNMKLNELLFYWSQNRKDIENMNSNKSTTCYSVSTFVNELFELFEDDTKFAAHLKLFQNPDPRKSHPLVN